MKFFFVLISIGIFCHANGRANETQMQPFVTMDNETLKEMEQLKNIVDKFAEKDLPIVIISLTSNVSETDYMDITESFLKHLYVSELYCLLK